MSTSYPLLNYLCAKCDFKGYEYNAWGEYWYVYSGIKIRVRYNIALCNDCNAIVATEDLTKPQIQKEQVLSASDKLRSELLSIRKSNPRCLKCGSFDFYLFPEVEQEYFRQMSNTPFRSGIRHKKCGGRIYLRYIDFISLPGKKSIVLHYDREGNRIIHPEDEV